MTGDELLDHADADPELVTRSLADIAVSNRWFGGWWAVRRGLERVLQGMPAGSTLTLLDIGTGLADLPRAAARWAGVRGVRLIPLGIERHRTAASLAKASGVATALATAEALPVRAASVDIVIVSQLVHHLAPEAAVALMQAADVVARRGVIVADLRRSSLALAGFWVGSRLLRFDPTTCADGLTSVRRGFTVAELRGLLSRAGVRARVERTPGFRLVASWRTATRGPT
ncbi:MAG TPA: methyltransferase domain-containing protein [Gemmatimonadales bacterium]|nr:methyltransferase domain-containing protein [Gemmatimonadales bacterium]